MAQAPAPLDLHAVAKKVHYAFHPQPSGGEFKASQPGLAIVASAQRLEVTPRARAGIQPPTIAFETVAIGRDRPALETHAARPRVDREGQLAISRDAAVERLTNSEAGLEQTFRFERAPGGSGDLQVRLRVTGATYAGKTADGHEFADPKTGVGLRYGNATWVEANGKKTAIAVRHLKGGELAVVVPEALLDGSVFPAEIDPIIGPRVSVNQPALGDANGTQTHPAISFDGTNYLVVWLDGRDIGGYLLGIDGTRVTPGGVILDPAGFRILGSLASDSSPAIAFDGTNYLVAALDSSGIVRANRVTPTGTVLDGSNGKSIGSTSAYVKDVGLAFGATEYLATWATFTPGDVKAQRVDKSGFVVGTSFTVYSGSAHVPRVSFDGANFLVAFRTGSASGAGPVFGARVSPTGAVLDTPAIAIGTNSDGLAVSTSAATLDAGTSLVVWQRGQNIVGARVNADGGVLDPTGFTVSATGSINAREPSVTSDGVGFLVGWSQAGGSTFDAYANRVTTGGTLLDGTGVVVSSAAGSQHWPIAACGAGSCLFAFEDGRTSSEIFGARVQAGSVLDAAGLHLSEAAAEQEMPAIARGNNQYLVVWEDHWNAGDPQIYGARVDLTGTVLDPTGINLCSAVLEQAMPRVASANGDFFVVWQDKRAGVTSYTDLYGTQVLADGTVVNPGGLRLTTANESYTPTIASNGASYLLAWYEASAPFTNNLIYASRLSATGTMLDAPPLVLTPSGGASSPSVTFGAGNYFVTYEGPSGLRATRIPPTGAPIDAPPGLLIGPSGLGSAGLPSASYDGVNYVVAYRRVYQSSVSTTTYRTWATRVAVDGGVLDSNGILLSPAASPGYTGAYYRMGPEATFDGVDTVVVWSSSFDGAQIFGAWLHPDGGAFGATTLVSNSSSIPLNPAIAGQGDGDHSLLVFAYGDQAPGIRNFRATSQRLTFRIDGHACSTTAECKSGFCVDGVCCNTACGFSTANDCQACSVAAGGAVDGTCSPIAAGTGCRASQGVCDVAESCDGVGLLCPADNFVVANTECRASLGTCDPAEKCTGNSAACPADALAATSVVCRASVGPCDSAESCTGSSVSCPADALKAAGQECRASAGGCDPAEVCDGLATGCPSDVLAVSGVTCRAAAGPCDVSEACTGGSAQCPTDAFVSTATVCRPSAGVCDQPESCSGASSACPADAFKPTSSVCRASAGACDVAESCTGSSATCPAEAFAATGTQCRPAAGLCDLTEVCTGSGPTCPADAFVATGSTCRPAAAGGCDVAEKCSGLSSACPADVFQPNATVCRPAAGPCDVSEACSGSSATCPVNAFTGPTVVCRAATGPCDTAEKCTGTSAPCPADALATAGTVCRASAGACDSAETCSGSSDVCPPDALAPSGAICRPAAGLCDEQEKCSGIDVSCPVDGLAPPGTICRPSTGVCDAAETCSGSEIACPTDAFAPSTTVCRASSGPCDPAETCTGTGLSCPAEAGCDDHDACTEDTCGATRCEHTPIASCKPVSIPPSCGCSTGVAGLPSIFVLGLLLAGFSRRRVRTTSARSTSAA